MIKQFKDYLMDITKTIREFRKVGKKQCFDFLGRGCCISNCSEQRYRSTELNEIVLAAGGQVLDFDKLGNSLALLVD